MNNDELIKKRKKLMRLRKQYNETYQEIADVYYKQLEQLAKDLQWTRFGFIRAESESVLGTSFRQRTLKLEIMHKRTPPGKPLSVLDVGDMRWLDDITDMEVLKREEKDYRAGSGKSYNLRKHLEGKKIENQLKGISDKDSERLEDFAQWMGDPTANHGIAKVDGFLKIDTEAIECPVPTKTEPITPENVVETFDQIMEDFINNSEDAKKKK